MPVGLLVKTAGWSALIAASLVLVALLGSIGNTSLRESRSPTEGDRTAAETGVSAAELESPARYVTREILDPDLGAESRKRDEALEAEEPELPPTPEQAGPGHALLRIETFAQETRLPLPKTRLHLGMEEDLEFEFSEQLDPSRGVEGDDVYSDSRGRGEFILRAGRAYVLYADGESGKAGEADLELEPFVEGEVREVRLELPTAYDVTWYGCAVDVDTALPIAGAEVQVLMGHDASSEGFSVLVRGRTDGNGRVELRVPSWEHALCARFDAPFYFWRGIRIDESSEEKPALAELHRPASMTVSVALGCPRGWSRGPSRRPSLGGRG